MKEKLLILSVLSLFFHATSWAYDFYAENEDGVTIYYNILSSSNRTCEVTYLSSNNKYNYHSENVVIPDAVEYNGKTYSVTAIGSSAFENRHELTSVTIPESVKVIDMDAFQDCIGLRSIISVNSEPPYCFDTSTFANVRKNLCTVYVPEGSKLYYELDDVWGEFYFIEEMDMTPVSSITADGNAEAVSYYTTDGKQVPTLQRGINIIRYSDGTGKKVLVN